MSEASERMAAEIALEELRNVAALDGIEKATAEQKSREIEDQIRELHRKIAELKAEQAPYIATVKDIQRREWNHRGAIKRAEQAVEAAKLREEEAKRLVEQEQERIATYENLREFANERDFAWKRYAMDHQWDASLKIAVNGSTLLADEMGLGKTFTCIMTADFAKAKRIITITPADVTMNFFDEWQRWAPHRNVIPMKSATKDMKKFMIPIISDAKEMTLVMNYETLWGRAEYNKEFMQTLIDFEPDIIFLDEAHVVKNSRGLNFDVLSRLKAKAKMIVPISGTFLLNSPEDLWTNLNLIDPQAFYNKNVFLAAYCNLDWDTGKYVFKTGGAQRLIHDLRGRIIRRTLDDTGIKLPKQTINEVLIPYADVPETQKEIMLQIKKHAQIMLDEIDPVTGDPKHMSITAQIAIITRLRQAAVWPAGIKITECDYDEDGEPIKGTERVIFDVGDSCRESIKMDKAVELLTKAKAEGKRSVVFSQFKTALAELEQRLGAAGFRVARFDGDTPDAKRQEIKADFLRAADGSPKENPLYDVVLANFKTGGVGLTFTEATYMLMLDEEWNPGKNEQAYKRIHRIGQTEETTVDILRIDRGMGVIDTWMKELNEYKKAQRDGLEMEIDMQSSLSRVLETGEVVI